MCESMLLTLPEELVAYIADYIPVDSIVNFALSCSATFRHTKYRLARNQIFHAESRLQHDRQPLHASDTLRRALSDPDTIWHLRDFESWGVRPGFGKWKSWSFQYDIPDGYSIEPYEDHSALDSNFHKPSEMIVYRMIMMDKLHMSVEEVYKWTERIRDGWDEPIKGILFAIAPMLDRLNFIAYDTWQSSEFQPEDPLDFICTAIRSVYGSLEIGAVWPPGFASLREVSICSSTQLRHPHDAFYANPSRVAPLFLLPNIKILHLSLIGYEEDPDPDFFLPPGSSSVQALCFYCVDMTLQARIKFIQACRRLRSFKCVNSSMGASGDFDFWRALIKVHGAWLESLSMDHYQRQTPTLSTKFPKLKHLDYLKGIDWVREYMVFTDRVAFRCSQPPCKLESDGDCDDAKAHPLDLREALPATIERLGLGMVPGGMCAQDVSREILSALADLAEDERFTNLKEICLYDLKPSSDSTLRPSPNADFLARLHARNIETHLHCDRVEHMRMHRDADPLSSTNKTEPSISVTDET
ncbi:hypothetical protein CKM354_000105200 [Cercospora kikuchii]|uniref:F-box domain-containing protein n=1 Tax=Cercospora kikuchii TaxID=84275 RepID=A0A9P3C737_9PEZI|nr:uncharacterized protein CKM354_000105200 [Cercospora kikuchii]GIZ37609.1 hypothetical protein CKM354_000105200 [Cercospora kikuchii]